MTDTRKQTLKHRESSRASASPCPFNNRTAICLQSNVIALITSLVGLSHIRWRILLSILGDRMAPLRAQLMRCWELDALIFLCTDLPPNTQLAGLKCRTRGELRAVLLREAASWKPRTAEIDMVEFSNLDQLCRKAPRWNWLAWGARGSIYKDRRNPTFGAAPPVWTAMQAIDRAEGVSATAAEGPQAHLHIRQDLAQSTVEVQPAEEQEATVAPTAKAAPDAQAVKRQRTLHTDTEEIGGMAKALLQSLRSGPSRRRAAAWPPVAQHKSTLPSQEHPLSM